MRADRIAAEAMQSNFTFSLPNGSEFDCAVTIVGRPPSYESTAPKGPVGVLIEFNLDINCRINETQKRQSWEKLSSRLGNGGSTKISPIAQRQHNSFSFKFVKGKGSDFVFVAGRDESSRSLFP